MSIGGTTVAVRSVTTGGGWTIDWLLGNHQGSITAAVRSGTGAVTRNWFDPYGGERGSSTMVTDRDFLGQETDTAVGLSYLNNRYYDPAVGMFLSVDPLVATTGEAYVYGSGSPITLSDPSGLCSVSQYEGETCAAAVARNKQSSPATPSDTGLEETTSVPEEIAVAELGSVQGACFICWTLTPLHNRAAELIAERMPGARQDWGCRIPSGRPDICRDTPLGLEVAEVKYDNRRGLDAGRDQLLRYRRDNGVRAQNSGDWPAFARDHIGVAGFGVTLEVRLADNGLYLYKVIPDPGLTWTTAAVAASSFLRAQQSDGGRGGGSSGGGNPVPDPTTGVMVAAAAATAYATIRWSGGGFKSPRLR